MSKTLSMVRDTVRQMVRDEYVSGTVATLEWKDNEIDQAIRRSLVRVSEVSPLISKETLTTTADSKELDISSIRDDLLRISHVEYKVGKNPVEYRNIKRRSDTILLDIDWSPEASESVYLFCEKVHTLTSDDSSLSPQEEIVLEDGATAMCAQNWLNKARTEITLAIARIEDVNTGVDDMAARVTQAVTDLASGRAKVVAKATEINTAIGNMSARITAAIGDLTSGRAVLVDQRDEALVAITAARTELAQSVADLDSGRAIVGNLQATADTAMDAMAARITQAIADIASARALVETITPARAVSNFSQTANAELNAAMAKLTEANGFLGQSVEGDRYRGLAGADVNAAVGYLGEAGRLLQAGTPATTYGNYAARELQNANTYLNQARGYLAHDAVGRDFMGLANGEIRAAQTNLAKSAGYAREIGLRLQNTRALSAYINWANIKMAEFERGLTRINKPRSFKEYPSGGNYDLS